MLSDSWGGVCIRPLLNHAVLNTQPILTYIFKLSILTTTKMVSFTLPPRVDSERNVHCFEAAMWGGGDCMNPVKHLSYQ